MDADARPPSPTASRPNVELEAGHFSTYRPTAAFRKLAEAERRETARAWLAAQHSVGTRIDLFVPRGGGPLSRTLVWCRARVDSGKALAQLLMERERIQVTFRPHFQPVDSCWGTRSGEDCACCPSDALERPPLYSFDVQDGEIVILCEAEGLGRFTRMAFRLSDGLPTNGRIPRTIAAPVGEAEWLRSIATESL